MNVQAQPVRPTPSRVHSAKLQGFDGPFFPHNIERLQRAYSSQVFGRKELDKAAHSVHAHQENPPIVVEVPQTNDGYQWYVGYGFRTRNGGEMRVLLPRADHEGIADRHCAIYTRGLSGNAVEGVMSGLALNFSEALR